MAYTSVLIGIIYLLSCPIVVSLNIKGFDYYCAFYLMLPATSYTLYNIKRIAKSVDPAVKKDQTTERRINRYFKIFNVSYVVFCIGAACLLNRIPIAAFAFFPLIISTIRANLELILKK